VRLGFVFLSPRADPSAQDNGAIPRIDIDLADIKLRVPNQSLYDALLEMDGID
jgi:hypothetical protein